MHCSCRTRDARSVARHRWLQRPSCDVQAAGFGAPRPRSHPYFSRAPLLADPRRQVVRRVRRGGHALRGVRKRATPSSRTAPRTSATRHPDWETLAGMAAPNEAALGAATQTRWAASKVPTPPPARSATSGRNRGALARCPSCRRRLRPAGEVPGEHRSERQCEGQQAPSTEGHDEDEPERLVRQADLPRQPDVATVEPHRPQGVGGGHPREELLPAHRHDPSACRSCAYAAMTVASNSSRSGWPGGATRGRPARVRTRSNAS